MKTVIEIVKQYLIDNGFDGLHFESECGCDISDLNACDENFSNCKPGYRIIDESGEYDYLITSKKPNKKNDTN